MRTILNPFRVLLAAALVSALGVVAAPVAQASTTQESVFQDDTVLLSGNPGPYLDQMKSLGVNTVHTLVFWNRLAPNPESNRKPSGDLSDPNTYSAASWAPYDALVQGAAARGITVQMTPTGFTPRWAQCSRPGKYRNCQPSASEFQKFVTAIAKRYSGTFNGLPKVSRWSFWNEPNQIAWISPQIKSRQVVSAMYYRNLVYAGLAALKKTGHSHDKVLLGETSPTARGNSTDPTRFLLALFCVDSRGHHVRTKAIGCNKFKRFSGITAFAHHPYNTSAIGPALRKPRGKGDITLAVLSRLNKVLALGAKGHAIKRGLPVYFTEYGIQTNPPNPQYGVPPAKQAMWLNQADYTAYKNRTVKSVSQYELIDDPNNPDVFQTGLELSNGTPKPSLDAYRLPIWVTRKGSGISMWLWVRPNGGSAQTVQIQHDTGSGFQTIGTARTNSHGFATVRESGTSGTWRIAWVGPNGTTYFSRAGSVKDR
jgi:hypothetical protein